VVSTPPLAQPRLAFVPYADVPSVDDLVAPLNCDDVFTAAERRHCTARASLERWAGRLAAKRAVLACLGLDGHLAEVEVVPGPHEGQALPHLCERGHRPVVRLSGAAEAARLRLGLDGVELSISHADGLAAAVAVPVTGPDRTPGPS
jgi:phosphopantetheinyl transferase (holo-ACP synthase)